MLTVAFVKSGLFSQVQGRDRPADVGLKVQNYSN